ncbi:DUF3524 domain-containing protein, partial [bacterium]|nr:DUF3524 domain-containing protein [bacterium]
MSLRILAIEPYYGGSHRAFLDGLARHSSHQWSLLTMPARKWKWRMRGSAVAFARQLDPPFDLLFATDFLDLAALVGLCPQRLAGVPKVAYFHENQLTYPVADEAERDYQFGFTNITTCLAADRVFFNSAFHRREFLAAADALLRRMPDQVPEGVCDTLAERSAVLPLGCELADLDVEAAPRNGVPLVLWNHRWEYDKGPEDFFAALFQLADEGLPFRVGVAGETFRQAPAIFDEARHRLADRIEHFGYAASRHDYAQLLRRADICVSTAHHEFFGIAALEAVYCGAYPLWPNRLTYPEFLPEELHLRHLYSDVADLTRRLRHAIEHIEATRQTSLRHIAARFDWRQQVAAYDAAL